jgi:glycosyltransferase involved in cell wall biosynthesis
MKILQVIDKLDTGGAERVSVDISILLSKNKEIDVCFLCLLEPSDLDKELIENGIQIFYLKRKNKFSLIKFVKLVSILNKHDIVHVHTRHVLKYIGLTYIPFLKKKFKVIFHDHYGKIEIDSSLSRYLKYCIKRSHGYIGVSNSLINWADSNKLNNSRFLLSNIIRRETKTIKIIESNDIIIVGNFRPQKNYSFLCKLINSLPNNVTIDLYGNVVNKAYFNQIKEEINNYGISERINLKLNYNGIAQFLNNYKLAIHCAESETGPLVAIEYMSQGIPFIMYDTGEVASVVKKQVPSLIMDSFNLNEWKGKVIELLINEPSRIKVSKKLKSVYLNNYSEEEYIKKCLKIYHKIINS